MASGNSSEPPAWCEADYDQLPSWYQAYGSYPPPPPSPVYYPYWPYAGEPQAQSVSMGREVNHSSDEYTYTVQVVNPTKRAEYTVHTLATKQRFSSRLALASELSNSFPECNSSKVWYILPGHGFKGKRLLIGCDEDLQKLYEQSKRKRIMISLDCGIDDTPPPKRVRRALLDQPSDASDNVPATVSKTKKQSKSEAKMSRVQDIVERLKEKHGSNYSIEKLNCWAHMLDMEKHRSYDEPPNLPFFGTKAKAKAKTTYC